jgi:hypothetical protein
VIAVVTAIFVATLDWNKAKGYLSAGVSKATGRQLRINGDLKVELGWITRVRASQIQFENAPGTRLPGRTRCKELPLFSDEPLIARDAGLSWKLPGKDRGPGGHRGRRQNADSVGYPVAVGSLCDQYVGTVFVQEKGRSPKGRLYDTPPQVHPRGSPPG